MSRVAIPVPFEPDNCEDLLIAGRKELELPDHVEIDKVVFLNRIDRELVGARSVNLHGLTACFGLAQTVEVHTTAQGRQPCLQIGAVKQVGLAEGALDAVLNEVSRLIMAPRQGD